MTSSLTYSRLYSCALLDGLLQPYYRHFKKYLPILKNTRIYKTQTKDNYPFRTHISDSTAELPCPLYRRPIYFSPQFSTPRMFLFPPFNWNSLYQGYDLHVSKPLMNSLFFFYSTSQQHLVSFLP